MSDYCKCQHPAGSIHGVCAKCHGDLPYRKRVLIPQSAMRPKRNFHDRKQNGTVTKGK